MKSGTPSSSNPPKPRWDYDVYLSFRGEDTSKNFTDHLYSALRQAGIRTFRDDDKLPRGKTIFTDLFNAIRGSRISIVVFSKGYASSRWCLEELVEIVHCRNTIGQTLLPIFYHVDPSDIRKKTGTFEEAFARHEEGFQTDMERVQRWRVALTEAATASGWILVDDANGSEGIRVLVKEVSDEVCARLNSLRHPIRMFSFDDVDHKIQQQHELVGNSKCFGLGSRVIATSRDEQLRTELEAHEKYKVEDLHYCKSLQLSSSHASMMAHPEEDFLDEKGIDHYLQLTNKGHDYKFKFKYPKLFSGLTILDLDLDLRGVKSLHKLSRSIGMMSLVELMGLKHLHLSRTGSWSLPEALPLVDLSKISWSLPEALPLVDLSKMTGIRSSQKSLSSLAVLNDLNLSMTGSKSWPESLYSFEALTVLNLSRTGIRSLPESIVRLVNLKSLILRYCHRFMRLSPKVGELKQLQVLDLKGTEIMDLPENPRCPMLLKLFLHKNHKLRTIPPSFFDYMPALEILNLSRTGIRSLPESVVRLVSLKRLFLSYCHRFMRLSPKVGDLKQLQVLDLEGTEIMDLPEEINKLTNLTCLKFSCYGYMDDGSSVMQSDALVPCGLISALSHLEELMISVNPDDKWWNECVEDIVTEVCTLQSLNTLVFYFPKVELVRHFISSSPMWVDPSLSKFRLIVGHHVKRIMSRLPCNVEFELKRWERCLKYINGVAVPREIKKVLQYSTAFFLERHATVKKLSDFGIGNMKQLKCCVVGECNEVEVIMNEADVHEKDSEADAHEEDDEVDACEEDDSNEIVSKTSGAKKIVLGSLEYLCIYYMKNLRNIWEGPVQPKCLSLLKFLTLRTCPQLTTIFTKGLLDNLYNLEELTVDDCPSIKTIVSCEISAEHKTSHFLPNLKRISLHYMPKLDTISSGLHIAPRLGWLSFYNCPNLKNLLIEEESSKDLKKIEGERSWWEALEWRSGRPAYLDDIFVPINIWDC